MLASIFTRSRSSIAAVPPKADYNINTCRSVIEFWQLGCVRFRTDFR
jgi:hypothetical protein